jgi:hypothetical protein
MLSISCLRAATLIALSIGCGAATAQVSVNSDPALGKAKASGAVNVTLPQLPGAVTPPAPVCAIKDPPRSTNIASYSFIVCSDGCHWDPDVNVCVPDKGGGDQATTQVDNGPYGSNHEIKKEVTAPVQHKPK